MRHSYKKYIIGALLFVFSGVLMAQHPNLILTKQGVDNIKKSDKKPPLFEKVLEATIKEVDAEIELGIFVPIPKDMAGGYTHERHKKNFFLLQKAGNLYQLTGDEKYAVYVRDMFLEYAKIYPTLGLHPSMKSYATGKIFWQCLNDANWLVYSSQAYDCVYDFLTEEERETMETQLFRPMADFISIENPKFFNRIHNHSTWGNAAVGMMGLAMGDEELVKRALYGLDNDGLDNSMIDNDGGFIKIDGQNQAGFLAQLDFSFSPDGYFTEGPYYLRYAMTPFLLFSKALANNRPEMNIYDYRDGILKKAVYSLLNQTDAQGLFFPLNDSQKGMSWKAREVVAAVDIAYHDFGHDPMLLSVAQVQNRVLLDETGFEVARDIEKGLVKEYKQQAIAYRDGADGTKGGVAILRNEGHDNNEICAVVKYSAQGMGHGHFDKLSYSLYDEDGEVIQDYGSARWVNIDQKGGGRYLKENQTFAKQTIAHNTLVVNETSQYEGSVKKGEANHPDLYYFDVSNLNKQVVSAKEQHAYPNVKMLRTFLLLKDENLKNPVLVDVLKVQSDVKNQYDLPIWFQGHLMDANFEFNAELTQLSTLGESDGYQHIWKEASGHPSSENVKVSWFNDGKFFTMTSLASMDDELIFGRTGANDPEFNLRHDPYFIIRKKDATNTILISIVESHGTYNPVSEIPLDPVTSIQSVQLIHDSDEYTIFSFKNKSGKCWTVMISNQDNKVDAKHKVKVGKEKYSWKGTIEIK